MKIQLRLFCVFFTQQLMENIHNGPFGHSVTPDVVVGLNSEVVHVQIHHLQTVEHHAQDLPNKHENVPLCAQLQVNVLQFSSYENLKCFPQLPSLNSQLE